MRNKRIKQLDKLFRRKVKQYWVNPNGRKSKAYKTLYKRYLLDKKKISAPFNKKIEKWTKERRKLRKSTIVSLSKLLKKNRKHRVFAPAILLFLAEIHYELDYISFLDASEKYEHKLQLFDTKKIKDEPPAPKKRFSRTMKWSLRLLRQFPSSQQAASAYYLASYCSLETGKDVRSMNFLSTLMKKFPKNRYRFEGWLRMGEFYFRKRQFHKAKRVYQEILVAKKLSYYRLALYKLGWIHFYGKRWSAAEKAFTSILTQFCQNDKKLWIDFCREAADYVAWSLWMGGKANKKVLRYVHQQGTNRYHSPHVLSKVADVYVENKKWRQGVTLYLRWLSWFPLHRQRPILQMRLIQLYQKHQKTKAANLLRQDLLSLLSAKNKWIKKNRAVFSSLAMSDKRIRKVFSGLLARRLAANLQACCGKGCRKNIKRRLSQKIQPCIHWVRDAKTFVQFFPYHQRSKEIRALFKVLQ